MNGKEYLKAIGANYMNEIELSQVIANLVEDNEALSRLVEDIERGEQLPEFSGLAKIYFNEFAESEFWNEVVKRKVV